MELTNFWIGQGARPYFWAPEGEVQIGFRLNGEIHQLKAQYKQLGFQTELAVDWHRMKFWIKPEGAGEAKLLAMKSPIVPEQIKSLFQ